MILEANRNLVCLSREGHLAAEDLSVYLERVSQDQELFLQCDLTLDLCEGLEMPILSTPRSLDLVHPRTALWFHSQQPLPRFISLGVEQNQAARELGLPIESQNEDPTPLALKRGRYPLFEVQMHQGR